MNINDLIEQGEGSALEFKETLPKKERLAALICAFANTEGGDLVVGIRDKSLEIVGVKKESLFDTEQKIISAATTLLTPSVVPVLKTIRHKNKLLLMAHIEMGFDKPYTIKSSGQCYMRIGSSTKMVDENTRNRLALQSRGITWDSSPVLDAKLEDLDRNLIREFLEIREQRIGVKPPSKFDQNWLQKNKLASDNGGQLFPTAAAILMFTENPDEWIPGSGFEAARFEGEDARNFLDKAQFQKPVWKLYEEALTFLKKHIPTHAKRTSAARTEKLAFPELAFRELFINALVHRNYGGSAGAVKLAIFDDIIEITSPGPFPPGITTEDLGVGISVLRNPLLAKFLREIGLIESWGTGIMLAQKELSKAMLPPAEIKSKGAFTQVTSNWSFSQKMSLGEERVLELLGRRGTLSSAEISKELGVGERTVRNYLAELQNAGLVVKRGSTKAAIYQKR